MYVYSEQKNEVFKEENQILFLKIRDNARYLIKMAGAVKMSKIIKDNTGDSWTMMACVDRLVEIGDLKEINPDSRKHGQEDRIFVSNLKVD